VLALLSLLGHAAPAAADEPGVEPSTEGEEPGLSRPRRVSAAVSRTRTGFWAPRDRGPRLKVGYRTFSVGEMGGRDARYHGAAIDVFVYSGIVRVGPGLEATADDTERDNFLIAGVINLGVQYPARLTPFLDFTWGGGVLRRDVLDQDLVDFAYHVGIEGGGELFVGPVLVSLTLGWRRQAFRYEENDQVEAVYVTFDSFTAKVGFGF
jgi:hypothetical protein